MNADIQLWQHKKRTERLLCPFLFVLVAFNEVKKIA